MKSLLSGIAIGLLAMSCGTQSASDADITKPSVIRCAPPLADAGWYSQNTPAPLFEGMDMLHYPITTRHPEVQQYFNQGLLFAYGFNHAEAARSFFHATRIDSTCAMCYWGYAFVLGPNYNAGMEPDHYPRAYEAIQKAIKWSNNVTPKEKALIKAMAARYSRDVVDDRRPLDSAYMEAMKIVHHQFPDDVDIATMYAESLMDMHPWDLWEKNGTPKPWTPEIIKAIELAIKMNPEHPGGHHYYIHAVEASTTPERGMASAHFLNEGRAPMAGHLVHMPSHIYIRTGEYHLGSLSNLKALDQDSIYVTQCHAQGAYPLAYYPHNYHFLAACATLEGRSDWAIDASNKMADHVNHQGMLVPELSTLQHFYSIPYFVNVKFAKWQEILDMPALDSSLIYPIAIRHYARGMAYIGLKDAKNAKMELDLLRTAAQQDTLKSMMIWGINSMYSVVDIAQHVLEAKILAEQKQYDKSIRLLKAAITIEDELNYNEPPDWFFSVRHELGAVLLDAGKAAEAVKVYEEDLMNFPKNGWALNGLKSAYEKLNQTGKAAETDVLLKKAWAHANVELRGSLVK